MEKGIIKRLLDFLKWSSIVSFGVMNIIIILDNEHDIYILEISNILKIYFTSIITYFLIIVLRWILLNKWVIILNGQDKFFPTLE